MSTCARQPSHASPAGTHAEGYPGGAPETSYEGASFWPHILTAVDIGTSSVRATTQTVRSCQGARTIDSLASVRQRGPEPCWQGMGGSLGGRGTRLSCQGSLILKRHFSNISASARASAPRDRSAQSGSRSASECLCRAEGGTR